MAVDKKARNKRQYKWQKENTDRMNFMMPKGTKEEIKQAAEKIGINPSEFVRRAIRKELDEVNRG